MSDRCSVTVTIVNRLGLHARPAMTFVDMAARFQSEITVKRGDQEVDGKSIMGVMMLAAEKGAVLELVSEGPDCEAQIRAIAELIENGFGED